jgi:hypothetical protein
VCAVETRKRLGRKLVVAASLRSRKPEVEARERESVIAHRADVVLRLPCPATLDASTPVQRVNDTPAEDVSGDYRRREVETARWPLGSVGVVRSRLTEKQLELRPRRTKRGLRCHGEVELERIGQQEDAVDRGPDFKIDQPYRVELLGKAARPVLENIRDARIARDRKRKVQVREAIAAPHCKRAHSGSGNDALVFLCELKHSSAERIPLFDCEHSAAILAPAAPRKRVMPSALYGRRVAFRRARRWLQLDAVYCGGAALIALALAEPLGRFFHVSTLLLVAIGAVTACWALVLVGLTRTSDLRQPLRLVAVINAGAAIAVAVLAAVEPARAARLLLIAVAIEVSAFAVAQIRLLAIP